MVGPNAGFGRLGRALLVDTIEGNGMCIGNKNHRLTQSNLACLQLTHWERNGGGGGGGGGGGNTGVREDFDFKTAPTVVIGESPPFVTARDVNLWGTIERDDVFVLSKKKGVANLKYHKLDMTSTAWRFEQDRIYYSRHILQHQLGELDWFEEDLRISNWINSTFVKTIDQQMMSEAEIFNVCDASGLVAELPGLRVQKRNYNSPSLLQRLLTKNGFQRYSWTEGKRYTGGYFNCKKK